MFRCARCAKQAGVNAPKDRDGRGRSLTLGGAATHSISMAKPSLPQAKPVSRTARLAAALKANLKRRKAQARRRADPKIPTDGPKARD